MKRWLRAALSINGVGKTLGYSNIFKSIKFDFHSKVISKLDFQTVLIISPHPDDDVLGMGGTIKKMSTNNIKIVVAYLCDGAGGVLEGRPTSEELGIKTVSRRDPNLVGIRKQEAEEASKILGITQQFFFGYPDGKLASSTSALKATADLIERVKPDTIFLPTFFDNHGDHRVANEILVNASKNLPDDFPIWGYEIWTPAIINRLVDITLYTKTKQEAILAHQSQLKVHRFDKAIAGLNTYRGEINGLSGSAEGFLAAPLGIYKELYKKS